MNKQALQRTFLVLLRRIKTVRRQGFWERWRSDLREGLVHLVGLIMRRVFGEASGGFRWSFV